MILKNLLEAEFSFLVPLKEYKEISDFDPHKTVIWGIKLL